MSENKRIALYVRVSTEQQAKDGWSLDAQENVLKEEAKRQGKFVFKVYRDEGLSGFKMDRPSLQKLLVDVRLGLVDAVWVWKISRISRNLVDLLAIIELLKRNGVSFYSLSEDFDLNTPVGKFALSILGGIGEMQRKVWSDASLATRKMRIESGLWSTMALYGYKLVMDDESGKSKLILVPEQARYVKKMYELFADGYTVQDIAKIINADGYVGRYGKKIRPEMVRNLLRNPAYIGKFKYGGKIYEGTHTPIVSAELWERVNGMILSQKKQLKIDNYIYLLSGLLICPECGRKMVHSVKHDKDGRTYRYYHCRDSKDSIPPCHFNAVAAEKADAEVLAFLTKYLKRESFKKRVTATIKRMNIKHSVADFDKLLREKLGIVQKTKSLLEQYELGKISRDELLEQNTAYTERINAIDATVAEWSAENDHCITEKDVQRAFAHMADVLTLATSEQQKELIHLLIRAIYLDDERRLSEMDIKIPDNRKLKVKNLEKVIRVKLRNLGGKKNGKES